MLAPYPDIKINRSYRIQADDLHSLYVEESGSPEGYPVIVLHDGPGTGSDAYHRRLLDAERFRIVQYDQRGCGRSLPFAETRQNSLNDLVADVDMLLQQLETGKAVLVGFGWGARIAVEFARVNLEKINELVLCGYGYESKATCDWLFGGGARQLFPDEWLELIQTLELSEAQNLLACLAERMVSSNEFVQIQTAKAWACWLARIGSLHVDRNLVERLTHPHHALTLAKLSASFCQDMATEDGVSPLSELAANATTGTIVHGRYDAVCPLAQGFELHQRWPSSELLIVRDAGHSIYDPAMTDAVLRVISRVADRMDGVGKLNG